MTQTELTLPSQPAGIRASTMRAQVFDSYGPLSGLALREVARPTLRAHEVLVRVDAAALHIGDVFAVRGEPFAMRLATGLLRPKHGIPGFDVCGEVESVGARVTRFKPGERVFGTCFGSCAQLVSASEDTLAHAPSQLSVAQAAALTTSAVAALHAVRDVAKLAPGQKFLINGAAGGIGTFALQLARARGAEVTAVCSAQRRELMRALGAQHVIDYTREDFSQRNERYDVILDNVENLPLSACRRALTADGLLILNSGVGADGLALWVRLLKPLLLSPLSRQTFRRFISVPSHRELSTLAELAVAGTLKPVVGKIFALSETQQALEHIASGHALGKTIIQVR